MSINVFLNLIDFILLSLILIAVLIFIVVLDLGLILFLVMIVALVMIAALVMTAALILVCVGWVFIPIVMFGVVMLRTSIVRLHRLSHILLGSVLCDVGLLRCVCLNGDVWNRSRNSWVRCWVISGTHLLVNLNKITVTVTVAVASEVIIVTINWYHWGI